MGKSKKHGHKIPRGKRRARSNSRRNGNKHNEGRTIVAKWGKRRDSKFLKIEIVIDKDELNVINAEVTSNEVETAVKDLQDKGKEVKRFYGDKAYDANEVYNTGVEVVVPPREDAPTRRGHPARL
jgi:hypothetical protein